MCVCVCDACGVAYSSPSHSCIFNVARNIENILKRRVWPGDEAMWCARVCVCVVSMCVCVVYMCMCKETGKVGHNMQERLTSHSQDVEWIIANIPRTIFFVCTGAVIYSKL